MNANTDNTCALILSGGRGSRMNNADKGLLQWQNKTLIERSIANISQQLPNLAISANRNLEQYRALGYPLVQDQNPDYMGPLAGIAAAFSELQFDFLMITPVDCPKPPANLFERLSTALNADDYAAIAIADDGHRKQPLFGLYSRTILNQLNQALELNKLKVMQFIAEQQTIIVDFSDQPDAFKNFNQPDDMSS